MFKRFSWFKWIRTWLENPYRVFIACIIFLAINIIFDGTIFKIRELYLNKKQMLLRSEEIQTKNEKIVQILKQLKNPDYLEEEVRNRFNLAGEGDLVFIFPEDK